MGDHFLVTPLKIFRMELNCFTARCAAPIPQSRRASADVEGKCDCISVKRAEQHARRASRLDPKRKARSAILSAGGTRETSPSRIDNGLREQRATASVTRNETARSKVFDPDELETLIDAIRPGKAPGTVPRESFCKAGRSSGCEAELSYDPGDRASPSGRRPHRAHGIGKAHSSAGDSVLQRLCYGWNRRRNGGRIGWVPVCTRTVSRNVGTGSFRDGMLKRNGDLGVSR